MTILVSTSEPLVERLPNGEVSVCFDGTSWVRFRTVHNYRACREHLDREEAAHDLTAVAAFAEGRDAYHRRVQALRSERDAMRGAG